MLMNGYNGARLAAAWGALNAANPVLSDIGFAERWSHDDWTGTSGWNDHIKYWKNIGATYTPLSDTVRTRAEANWVAMRSAADNGSIAAEQMMEQIRGKLSAACDAVDADTKQYGGGSRSDAAHKNRARLLTNVNNAIKEAANAAIPAPPPVIVVPTSTPTTTTSSGGGPRTQQGGPMVDTSADVSVQQLGPQGGGGGAATESKGLPLSLIIPAALVGSVALLIFVKRARAKSSLSGYRRRRKSRRTRR